MYGKHPPAWSVLTPKKQVYFSILLIPLSSPLLSFPLLPHALSLRAAEALGLTELLQNELLMESSQTAGWITAIRQGIHSRDKNTGLFPVFNAVLVFLLLVSIRKIIIWFCNVKQLSWKSDAVHHVCKFKCRSKNYIVRGSKLLGIPIKMCYTWWPCLINIKKRCARYIVDRRCKWPQLSLMKRKKPLHTWQLKYSVTQPLHLNSILQYGNTTASPGGWTMTTGKTTEKPTHIDLSVI